LPFGAVTIPAVNDQKMVDQQGTLGMKVVATVAALITLGATPAFAQYDRPPLQGAVLAPYEMMTIVRSMGFDPISRPVLRGPVYVIRALDEDDLPVRVAIDAHTGNVVRVSEGGPGANLSGGWQRGRPGEFGLPPESVPPGAVYLPPRESGPREVMPPPPPPRPKVATRTPLPRAAPPQSKATATPPTPSPGAAAMADPKATPGKSVPAPVANKSSGTAAAQAPNNADNTAITGTITPTKPAEQPAQPAVAPETKPAELVPVAPLE
jgi:hypothetical protein